MYVVLCTDLWPVPVHACYIIPFVCSETRYDPKAKGKTKEVLQCIVDYYNPFGIMAVFKRHLITYFVLQTL